MHRRATTLIVAGATVLMGWATLPVAQAATTTINEGTCTFEYSAADLENIRTDLVTTHPHAMAVYSWGEDDIATVEEIRAELPTQLVPAQAWAYAYHDYRMRFGAETDVLRIITSGQGADTLAPTQEALYQELQDSRDPVGDFIDSILYPDRGSYGLLSPEEQDDLREQAESTLEHEALFASYYKYEAFRWALHKSCFQERPGEVEYLPGGLTFREVFDASPPKPDTPPVAGGSSVGSS